MGTVVNIQAGGRSALSGLIRALILMVVSVFWHLRLGLTVLIEDYVHGEATRLLSLVLLNFYAIGGAAYGIFAIVRIALAPAAGLAPGGM